MRNQTLENLEVVGAACFFASAAKHVELFEMEIYVSLCQGQGWTPMDNPRRELGNSWQVVYQASKSSEYRDTKHFTYSEGRVTLH